MKKGKSLMMVALMGLLLSGVNLAAAEETPQTEEVYIAVPMHMFDRLTGNKPEKKAPETFIYQDGKLVKCEADLQSLQKQCRKNNDRENCKEKSNHRKHKSDKKGRRNGKREFNNKGRHGKGGPLVLLTQDQMKDLMKQQLEKKLKDINNPDSEKAKAFKEAVQNAPVIKVNGKDAKVINPRGLFKKGHRSVKNIPPPAPAEETNN